MGKMFGKKFLKVVLILFMCVATYSMVTTESYAQTCYLCADGYWVTDSTCTGHGGRKTATCGGASTQPYYTLRTGFSCGSPCSNSNSVCNVPNFQLCNNTGGTLKPGGTPGVNTKAMCGQLSDCTPDTAFSCTYIPNAEETSWTDCGSSTCTCDNWDETNNVPWNWTNQCTCDPTTGIYGQ